MRCSMKMTGKKAGLHAGVAVLAITSVATPSFAQSSGDIIVTARRVEERLQDVPIAITVFNQQQLANHNVVDGDDLAKITPGLTSNSQFGKENTVFNLRGFKQDIGTAPTVGVYFADVVAPRGGSSGNFAGDGAGAGSFFDLQNVQVLKGPQGTLQGRNTTGGAVMLVPQKPTDSLEGYVEGSIGNYDGKGIQAVLNVPLSDTFRVRLGVDRQKRDGYLRNVSGVGVKDFNDTNYLAVRASVVGDLTPDLETYTIASYTKVDTHGTANKLIAVNPTAGLALAFGAEAQLRSEAAQGWYTAASIMPDQAATKRTWQVINTTTWHASDSLTVKNIISYAEMRASNNVALFGTNFKFLGTSVYSNMIHSAPGIDTTSQSTFTEELQFQGQAMEGKLHWQAGAYFEKASPLGGSGNQTVGFGYCPAIGTSNGVLPGCFGLPGLGAYSFQVARTTFEDKALYAQLTYELTDKLSFTGGFRYTWDKMRSVANEENRLINPFNPAANNLLLCIETFTPPIAGSTCPTVDVSAKSKAPTWLLGVDFKPNDNLLIYAKYSRGYRAGGVKNDAPNLSKVRADLPNYQIFKPEKVDAFEGGVKATFDGAIKGTFNVAAFYNKFSDQQVMLGLFLLDNASLGGPAFACTLTPYRPCPVPAITGGTPTSAPVNVGKSRMFGLDADVTLNPVEGLNLYAGYAYVNSKVKAIQPLPPIVFTDNTFMTSPSAKLGFPLSYAPKHKLVLNADYTLPLPEEVGDISLGATWTYTSRYYSTFGTAGQTPLVVNGKGVVSTATSEIGHLPSTALLDLNLNWKGVLGSPVDLAFWATNVTKKKYLSHVAGLIGYGFDVGQVGAPRMYGLKARVRF